MDAVLGKSTRRNLLPRGAADLQSHSHGFERKAALIGADIPSAGDPFLLAGGDDATVAT